MKCKKCKSKQLVKNGINKNGNQVWKCKVCGCRGTMQSKVRGEGKKRKEQCKYCESIAVVRGMCRRHYHLWRKESLLDFS